MPVGPDGRARWQRRMGVALILTAVIAGAVLRGYRLDLRVVHGDEANQAVKTAWMLEGKPYRYDPNEHHGPTLYYLTYPLLRILGARSLADTEIWEYRLVPALAGTLLIVMGGLAAWHGGGPIAAGVAAWMLALSNGTVFYSRYYIQETLLALFVVSGAWALLRIWRHPEDRLSWLGLGLAIGLAHATKETCIYFFAAGALAFACAWFYGRLTDRRSTAADGTGTIGPDQYKALMVNLALAAAAAACVSVLFYTSFFSYLPGAWHSVAAYFAYIHRAGGQGSSGIHDKPWHYYLHLLGWYQPMAGPRWSEWPVLVLALVGGVDSFVRREKRSGLVSLPTAATRFLFLFMLLSFAAFSLTPYKTPWNILTPLALCCVLAGIGASRLLGGLRRLGGIPAVLAGMLVVLGALAWEGRQAWLGNFVYPADARNPYVYAHTTSAIRRLEERVYALSALHPDGPHMPVYVVRLNGDYWPLPWYFRRLDRVGYWTGIPDSLPVPVVIAGNEAAPQIAETLGTAYFSETHALRPGVLLRVFIRRDLWEQFLETRHAGSSGINIP